VFDFPKISPETLKTAQERAEQFLADISALARDIADVKEELYLIRKHLEDKWEHDKAQIEIHGSDNQ